MLKSISKKFVLSPSLSLHCHLWYSSRLTLFNKNVIQINRPPLPVYQNVIEKTRQLAVRTQALGVTVSRTGQGTNVSPPKGDNKEQVVQAVTVN